MATNPAVSPTTGMEIRGPVQPGYDSVLTPAALEFVAGLTRRFGDRVNTLLDARGARQRQLDEGALPDFLPETRSVREGDWRVTSIPADLQDRRDADAESAEQASGRRRYRQRSVADSAGHDHRSRVTRQRERVDSISRCMARGGWVACPSTT